MSLEHAAAVGGTAASRPALVATVRKAFDFPAAHANAHHPGHCSRIHGHTWTAEVFARGPVVADDARGDFGMAVEFGELKRAYRERVEPYVEHQYLNESLADFALPEYTTEWIAWWILERMRAAVPQVFKIRLWEGKTSYAEVEA